MERLHDLPRKLHRNLFLMQLLMQIPINVCESHKVVNLHSHAKMNLYGKSLPQWCTTPVMCVYLSIIEIVSLNHESKKYRFGNDVYMSPIENLLCSRYRDLECYNKGFL